MKTLDVLSFPRAAQLHVHLHFLFRAEREGLRTDWAGRWGKGRRDGIRTDVLRGRAQKG